MSASSSLFYTRDERLQVNIGIWVCSSWIRLLPSTQADSSLQCEQCLLVLTEASERMRAISTGRLSRRCRVVKSIWHEPMHTPSLQCWPSSIGKWLRPPHSKSFWHHLDHALSWPNQTRSIHRVRLSTANVQWPGMLCRVQETFFRRANEGWTTWQWQHWGHKSEVDTWMASGEETVPCIPVWENGMI